LAERPKAAIVAGGTDLIVAARSGKKPLPFDLIAIDRLNALRVMEARAEGGIRLGSLVTHSELEASPVVQATWSALSDASRLVGSPATRHIGTVGGNICNASPAMELGSPFLVFDAALELESRDVKRTLPFADFVIGPGQTTRRPDEILTSIVLPALPDNCDTGSAYVRLEYRNAMEIAVVGAAALLAIGADRKCASARVSLTAVAPTCVRASATEEHLVGRVLDEELLRVASAAATNEASPISDVRAEAEYRSAMISVIVLRALEIAWRRAIGSGH
jgi:CO/xanthine dehydrogenase FAD-binding subunit